MTMSIHSFTPSTRAKLQQDQHLRDTSRPVMHMRTYMHPVGILGVLIQLAEVQWYEHPLRRAQRGRMMGYRCHLVWTVVITGGGRAPLDQTFIHTFISDWKGHMAIQAHAHVHVRTYTHHSTHTHTQTTDYGVLHRTLCQISTLQSAKSRNLQTTVQHGHTVQALEKTSDVEEHNVWCCQMVLDFKITL